MSRHEPRRVLHIDLARPRWQEALGDDRDVQLYFWWGDRPLGAALIAATQASGRATAAVEELAAEAVAPAVLDELRARGPVRWEDLMGADPLSALANGSPPADAPSISVVICTRDRPEELARCLDAVMACVPRPDELIVVDNAPHKEGTRAVVAGFPDAVLVPEPRPGLSIARNAGVAHATGDVVAFTDDDTVVHRAWIARLRALFSDPDTVSMTGLVLPVELQTPAQVFFEVDMGGFGCGFRPRTFGRDFLLEDVAKGIPVWVLGAGANMAVRRQVLIELGGFDERLGAGAAGCSEDSELWYRVLAAGYEHRYDPEAVVFHRHRRDRHELRIQARSYVRGHLAALFVQFARHRQWPNLRRALMTLPWWYVKRLPRDLPTLLRGQLTIYPEELRGYLQGLRYLPLAWRSSPEPGAAIPTGKRRRREFLRCNPYPRPLTEGLFYREKMRAIHRVTPDVSPRRVLDVGGGQSGLASMLFPSASVTTIDRDAAYAVSVLNRHPRQRFLASDACRLPFADASFDVVTLFDVLEHITDDVGAVREVLRVLRPGGWVLVTSPNETWRFPYHPFMVGVCPTEQEVMDDWGHVRHGYHLDELTRLFGGAPQRAATFITPVTVLSHDVAFSRLPAWLRRVTCAALAPMTWLGQHLHRPAGPGTETASAWQQPADERDGCVAAGVTTVPDQPRPRRRGA